MCMYQRCVTGHDGGWWIYDCRNGGCGPGVWCTAVQIIKTDRLVEIKQDVFSQTYLERNAERSPYLWVGVPRQMV
jgi:hypothetical protein